MTECTQTQFGFQRLCPRKVAVDFEGGQLTTEGGIPLIGELDRRLRLTERFSQCFTDYRDPRFTEFSVLELLRQRIYGLVAGYEDLNDHQDLRRDSCLAATVGREDPSGQDRRDEDQKGHPLAGKSTLNRLELVQKGSGITFCTLCETGPLSAEFPVVLQMPRLSLRGSLGFRLRNLAGDTSRRSRPALFGVRAQNVP